MKHFTNKRQWVKDLHSLSRVAKRAPKSQGASKEEALADKTILISYRIADKVKIDESGNGKQGIN